MKQRENKEKFKQGLNIYISLLKAINKMTNC